MDHENLLNPCCSKVMPECYLTQTISLWMLRSLWEDALGSIHYPESHGSEAGLLNLQVWPKKHIVRPSQLIIAYVNLVTHEQTHTCTHAYIYKYTPSLIAHTHTHTNIFHTQTSPCIISLWYLHFNYTVNIPPGNKNI